MGISHLTSLLKDKNYYNIDIFDKRKNIKITIKKSLKFKKKINILKLFPKHKKYSLVIIATGPEVRYLLVKKLLKFNKVKILLLEKFLFKSKKEFFKFDKIISKKKINIFVNLWGKEIFKKLNLKKYKNRKIELLIILREKNLLTNLVHFYYLIKLLSKTNIIHIDFKGSKLIKKNYNYPYDEISGEIKINTDNISCKLISKKENLFSITINNYIKKFTYELKNEFLILKQNKKVKIKFPMAKYFTSLFYNNFLERNIRLLPQYHEIKPICNDIFSQSKKYFKKDLIIR